MLRRAITLAIVKLCWEFIMSRPMRHCWLGVQFSQLCETNRSPMLRCGARHSLSTFFQQVTVKTFMRPNHCLQREFAFDNLSASHPHRATQGTIQQELSCCVGDQMRFGRGK